MVAVFTTQRKTFQFFFDFLTALTDQLDKYYHANEPTNSYLKILDENGFWEKSRKLELIRKN